MSSQVVDDCCRSDPDIPGSASHRTFAHSSGDLIRSIVLVFVIFGALALAIDVKTTETLTGVIGVLSATAGYLFGRATSTADEKPRRDARPDEKEP